MHYHFGAYPCSGCHCWATIFLCPHGFWLKASMTLCLRAFIHLRRMLGQCYLGEPHWSVRGLTPWSSSQSVMHSSWWDMSKLLGSWEGQLWWKFCFICQGSPEGLSTSCSSNLFANVPHVCCSPSLSHCPIALPVFAAVTSQTCSLLSC